MKYWSRTDTKEWISQVENRICDIDYYLEETAKWCDEYGIDDAKMLFTCSFLTCVWVSQMRGELITFIELMDLLGVEEWEADGDNERLLELDEEVANLDHYDLLEQAVRNLNDDGEGRLD